MKLKVLMHPAANVRGWMLYGIELLTLFALYVGTARFGLSLQAVSGFASLVWLPSGLALAALLLFGSRLWPAILAGAVLVNVFTGASVLAATGIGIGNMLEALLGSVLFTRHGLSKEFDTLRDVLLFMLLIMPVSAGVSATMGVSSLLLDHVITFSSAGATWSAWWIGDMISILLIAPLVLTWSKRPHGSISRKRLAEMGLLAVLILAVGLLVFLGELHPNQRIYPLTYLVFPPLIWASLRFGPRGALCATVTFSTFAIIGTMRGLSPFAAEDPGESLLFLQSFIGVSTITALLLAAMMAERRTLEQRKDAFISMAGHELRTPLTSLQGYTELLQMKRGELSQQHMQRALSSMALQITRLSRLIDDLLDLSKMQAGKLPFVEEAVNLDVLVSEVVETLRQSSTQHQISIEGSTQGELLVDRVRLEQVVINLLSNAMKYSPSAQQIIVHLTRVHGSVRVSVQDFGLGIAQAQHQKIFERYYRVASHRDRSIPGFGIGLSIAQQIVEHYGGTLWVESEEGHGSTFSFLLPMQAKAHLTEPSVNSRPGVAERKQAEITSENTFEPD